MNPQDENPRFTVEVKGSFNGQTITFKSEKKSGFQQDFSGVLRDRHMRLEFGGAGRNGRQVQGNATLTVKEARSGEPPTAPKGPMKEIARVPIKPFHNVLAFSPDNERVAIDNGWNIKLLDLNTCKLLRDIAPGRPIVGNFNSVMSMDIAPDGTIIASYEDQTIRIWDRTGAEKIRELGAGPQGYQFRDLKYSRTGKWVIGRSQTEIRIWDLETGKEQKRYPLSSAVKSLDVHPNGRWIVSIHNDNVIRIWDARTGNPVSEFVDGTKKSPRLDSPQEGVSCSVCPEAWRLSPW